MDKGDAPIPTLSPFQRPSTSKPGSTTTSTTTIMTSSSATVLEAHLDVHVGEYGQHALDVLALRVTHAQQPAEANKIKINRKRAKSRAGRRREGMHQKQRQTNERPFREKGTSAILAEHSKFLRYLLGEQMSVPPPALVGGSHEPKE